MILALAIYTVVAGLFSGMFIVSSGALKEDEDAKKLTVCIAMGLVWPFTAPLCLGMCVLEKWGPK